MWVRQQLVPALAVAAGFALLSGCSPWCVWGTCSSDAGAPTDAGSGCRYAYVGDPATPMSLTLTALGKDDEVVDLQDGSPVPLMFPPQGGRVAFIGVRARHLSLCGVQLNGAVRDLDTQQVRVDNRPVMLRATDAGEAESVAANIASFSNIPLCPNQWSSQDVYGHTYRLEVSLVDGQGKRAEQQVLIQPFCEDPFMDQCLCQCRQGYVLGESCDLDGGAMDASPGDAG